MSGPRSASAAQEGPGAAKAPRPPSRPSPLPRDPHLLLPGLGDTGAVTGAQVGGVLQANVRGPGPLPPSQPGLGQSRGFTPYWWGAPQTPNKWATLFCSLRTRALWVAGSPLIPADTIEFATHATPTRCGGRRGSGRSPQAQGQAHRQTKGACSPPWPAQLKDIFVIFDQLMS